MLAGCPFKKSTKEVDGQPCHNNTDNLFAHILYEDRRQGLERCCRYLAAHALKEISQEIDCCVAFLDRRCLLPYIGKSEYKGSGKQQ